MSFLRGGRNTARSTTPAPRAGQASDTGGGKIDGQVPHWDGKPQSLEAFEEEVELWMAGAEDRVLPLMGPRIARAHEQGTKQRSVALALGMKVLRTPEGPSKIVEAFRSSLADKHEADLWSTVQEYIFGGQRPRGQDVASFVVQEGVIHEKAVKALKTIGKKSPEIIAGDEAASGATEPVVVSVFPDTLRAFLLLMKASLRVSFA